MKTATNTEIRWLIRRDLPDVLRVANRSFLDAWDEDQFVEYLRNANVVGKVAEVKGIAVSYMLYELHPGLINLTQIAVDPIYRRTGIGKQLLSNLKSKLSLLRRNRIYVDVSEYNLDAQLWLRDSGFKAYGCEAGINFRYQLEG